MGDQASRRGRFTGGPEMFLFWMSACSDNGFSLVRADPLDAEPDIQVEPAAIAFDPTAVGCKVDAPVTITNVGEGPLDVDRTWLLGSDETLDDYAVEGLDETIFPGSSAVVLLQFSPSSVWDATAEVVVDSDDPDEARVRLPVSGSSYDPTWTLDVFNLEPDPIDVLWVIDNSGSMWQERERVTTEISRFFEWFIALDLDYHMGVITTDTVNPQYSGQLVGNPTFVTPTTPDPQGTLARSIDVGGLEMGDEAGLLAMEMALSEPLLSDYNDGFYREDARLAVIFLTDEPEQSDRDADSYIDFLSGLKEEPDDVFVAAIVGDREEGCSGECDAEAQEAGAGDKYLDVAAAFGGFEESICTCDLAPAMERMGFESTWYVRSFPLSETPGVPTLINVWVDGEKAAGWSYDPAQNAVVFDTVPPLGSEIVIQYTVDDPCAP